MKITCNVNQAAALARGIDAPSSTVVLDVDPGALGDRERKILAACLREGHEAYGGYDMPGGGVAKLVLREPTAAGLDEAIAGIIARVDAAQAEYLARQAERRADALAAVEAYRAGGTMTERVYESHPWVEITIEVPYLAQQGDTNIPEWRVAHEEYQARRVMLIESARAGLREQQAAIRAAEAAEAAEQDALASRLPEALRSRRQAGYCPDDEWQEELAALLVAEAGYQEPLERDSWEKVKTMTDEQYTKLVALQAAAPTGATVEAVERWDDPAVYDDGEDDQRMNIILAARIAWTRAGVQAETFVDLE